jgi:hypothetical protein
MKTFCLDTSSIIDAWRRYPDDLFPSFWDKLDLWARDCLVVAPDEVKEELRYGDDDVYAWAKQRPYLFRPPEAAVQETVTAILRAYPQLVDANAERTQADPFVIALAQVTSSVVVTQEGRNNPNKIPRTCQSLGLECIDILGLMREMELRY